MTATAPMSATAPSVQAWAQLRHSTTLALPIVIGTMNFGKRTPEPEAHRLVHRALERRVVHFDTANAYVAGEGERILGRALRGKRQHALIASKVGLSRIGGVASGLIAAGGSSEGLSRARIIQACEESLERLGTDYLDLYFLHVPDQGTPIEESVAAMGKLLEAGKIRAWATSNYASWQLLEMIHYCDVAGVTRPILAQQMYNLLVRQLELEYFAFAKRYGLHTTAYNPLAGGMLSGKHQMGTVTPGSRFDDNPMYQRRYYSAEQFRRLEDYRALAAKLDLSLPELAFAWLASRPGVDSVVIGPASVEHLDHAIDALERRLSAETLAELDLLYVRHQGTDASYARI